MSIFGRGYEILGAKALPTSTRIVREPSLGGHQSGPYAKKHAEQHLKAYGGGKDGIDWFYDAAGIIATAVGDATFHFEDDKRDQFHLRPEPQAPPNVHRAPWDLAELFTYPNPYMTWREHVELTVIDLLAVGDAYWLKWPPAAGDRPFGLFRMTPAWMEVIPGQKGSRKLIKEYRYGFGDEAMHLRPDQVVHMRLPNPNFDNGLMGVGAVQAAPQAFDIELGLLEAQRNYFANGTVLAGTVTSDRGINDAQRRKFMREFRNMHQGSGRWFNVAFMERGLKYEPIQANAQEAQYEKLSKLSRDRIFAMLGVPRVLAGLDDTLKLQEARRLLAEDKVGPFLRRLQEIITWRLVQAWGLELVFDYGYQMPEEDRIKLALEFSQIPGVRVFQVLEKAGLDRLGPEFEDEDGFLIDDYVLNMPGPSTEGPGGIEERAHGPEGGRPADTGRRFPLASPNAGDRDGDEINGRPASAADRARRSQQGVVRVRRRVPGTGKAGINAASLASGSWRDKVGA